MVLVYKDKVHTPWYKVAVINTASFPHNHPASSSSYSLLSMTLCWMVRNQRAQLETNLAELEDAIKML